MIELKDKDIIKQQKKEQQKILFQKELEAALNEEEDEIQPRTQDEIEREFVEKHKNLRKHWEFPMDFPNFDIIKAYKDPSVD